MSDPIYLDYNATTPVAPEVRDAMVDALSSYWGNPSSHHAYGAAARAAIDRAREAVAALLDCEADEVVFTGGGTEADNAAILGIAEARADQGRHVVISAVEHAAVDKPCRVLEDRGWTVTRVDVDRDGRVDAAAAIDALRDDTTLVSIIHGQNETGVIQPVAEIGEAVRARGIVMHSDTAQSIGKLPVSLDGLNADVLTLAGHKLYAPKGVGALVVRRGTSFRSYALGAGHESGRRAGTENTPGIVALGAACDLARAEADSRRQHLQAMRDRLADGLRARFPDLIVHGERVERLPNTLSVAIPGIQAHGLLANVPGLATGAGQACHSGKPTLSRTLLAMGVSEVVALATMRLCVGRGTRAEEIDQAVAWIAEAAAAQRHGASI